MFKSLHSCPFQKGTFITRELLLSKAYISLSSHAKLILAMFLLKRQMPGNYRSRKSLPKETVLNNGEIELSYKEIQIYGLDIKQISRAFDDVISKGFIEMTQRGGKGKKSYNKYQIIDDWKNYGTDAFIKRNRIKSHGYGFCNKKT